MSEGEFKDTLRKAVAGDLEAIESLLMKHLPDLRAYVRLKSGSKVRARESCSDLVQSVCREVLSSLDSIERDDEAGFRAWLFGIAHHKVLRRVERLQAAKSDPDREVALDDVGGEAALSSTLHAYGTFCTPSRTAETREELARIESAMDRLRPEDRDLIIRARLIGSSHEELAHEFGKTPVAVRKMLSRARARLGLLLESPSADSPGAEP